MGNTALKDMRGLGRGLSALLGDAEELGPVPVDRATAPAAAPAKGAPAAIPIDLIDANPGQPRRHFDDDALAELAASIRSRGVLQPIILRPSPERAGRYQIVAGERRWRAAQLAQVHDIPAILRDIDDRAVLELAIIENVQRADLRPLEEARGYAQLIEAFAYTQEALGQALGKSRSHVANTLRLLTLPEPVQRLLEDGQLTAGHARALVTAADPVALAFEAVTKGLTVRQVEAAAKELPAALKPRAKDRARGDGDADTKLLEGDLSAAIGMKVKIRHGAGDGTGELRIRYASLEDLDRLCQRLGT
ncbi:MAG: ParB/RepB/Spo0J family partition protein [Paracoccaceae bacterium]